MKIEADFEKISTEFQSLPAGTYPRMLIDNIDVGETSGKGGAPKLPMLTFSLEVAEAVKIGDEEVAQGRKINDFVVLKKKDGSRNDVGLGRLKAYGIAVLGEAEANGGSIDTDQLKGGVCSIIVKQEPYDDNGTQKMSSKVAKVLPVG